MKVSRQQALGDLVMNFKIAWYFFVALLFRFKFTLIVESCIASVVIKKTMRIETQLLVIFSVLQVKPLCFCKAFTLLYKLHTLIHF